MRPEPKSHDAEVLVGAARGEPGAVRTLLDEVAPVVYGFLYARVGGDEATAQDLLQDTLLEGMRSATGFRGEATLRTWFCTIAKRRLSRHYESERRRAVADAGLRLMSSLPAADDRDLGVEQRDEVVQALGRLPALHRQVLVLKYLDDLSVGTVADELGRTAVQIQSLLQRAREGLRRELGSPGG